MRTIKKIGVWILLVCLFMTQVVPAYATQVGTTPTLVAETVVAEAGAEVHVNIEMHNNPGIVSMMLEVAYDDTVLSLVGTDSNGDACLDGVIDGEYCSLVSYGLDSLFPEIKHSCVFHK